MKIIEPLPEFIELEYQDKVWQQHLDYEHISFWCKICHEYGHLYQDYPLNQLETPKTQAAKDLTKHWEDSEGFHEVQKKKRNTKTSPTSA